MNQYEAVEQAMRDAGGYATLGQLYRTATRVPGSEWGTRTPFASIRRIVQTHPGLFFRIKPGLWGLSKRRHAILEELGIAPARPLRAAKDFDHTYYQGLLVEIGNLEGYQTPVPNQDKNRVFLRRPLADVATAGGAYDFTYGHILQKARTVDVIWYNERRFPNALFEVEHSTDIEHSLVKFLEFQDFRLSLRIVADGFRKREYRNKLSASAFAPIRDKVDFWDYDFVSDLHSKLSASAAVEQRAFPK